MDEAAINLYAADGQQPIEAEIALCLAPTPSTRSVDRWQPLAMNPSPLRAILTLFESGGIPKGLGL